MEKVQYNEKIESNLQFLVLFLGILTIIAVGYVLTAAKEILLPFALAVFVSFILYPVIEFFEKKKIPGPFATLVTIIIFGGVIYLFVFLISDSIQSFSSDFEKYEPRIQKIHDDIESFLLLPTDFIQKDNQNESTILSEITDNLSLGGFITSAVGSISSIISNVLLIALILVFMLMGRKQLRLKISLAFEKDTSLNIGKVLDNINSQIQKFIIVKTLVSLATALLFVLVLAIFGVEFVAIWGVLAFVLNFIPNIGSLIATILPLSVAFLQFDEVIIVLWIAILLLLIQQILGNIIEPKFLGKSVNLSPLVILFSLVFWGWLWGIVGMFLSIPITVIIKIILENLNVTRPIAVIMGSGK